MQRNLNKSLYEHKKELLQKNTLNASRNKFDHNFYLILIYRESNLLG